MGEAVGYVGMGVMGLPFAVHLSAAGHDVRVFDKDPAAMQRARDRGLLAVTSLDELVEHATFVFTCLPDPEAVMAVMAGIEAPGRIVCDNSTIGPTMARHIHSELGQRSIAYVECPMLGGVGEAEDGRLFLVVSGDAPAIERVLPLALLAARDHRVVGGTGVASLMKSVQNGLGLVQMTAIAEALALVASAGGDLDAFVEVVGHGGGMAATPLFRAKAPMMLEPLPVPVGRLHIGAKDAALAAGLAREHGLDLPLFARSEAVYRRAIEAGLAEADVSAIVRIVEAETGSTIRRGPADA